MANMHLSGRCAIYDGKWHECLFFYSISYVVFYHLSLVSIYRLRFVCRWLMPFLPIRTPAKVNWLPVFCASTRVS